MKLNIIGCRSFCKEYCIKNYVDIANSLGLSVVVVRLLEQGKQIGYEAVKDIYNKHGEQAVEKLIDFEEETLNGFKSKYILVGNKLY